MHFLLEGRMRINKLSNQGKSKEKESYHKIRDQKNIIKTKMNKL